MKQQRGPQLWYKGQPSLRFISQLYGNKKLDYQFLQRVLYTYEDTERILQKECKDLKLLLQAIRDVTEDQYFESKGIHREIINSWIGLLTGMIEGYDKRIADLGLDIDMVQLALVEWRTMNPEPVQAKVLT